MGKVFTYTIAGLMAVLLLFILSLALGSVSIPIQDIIAILLGKEEGVANPSYSYIVLESRLPQAFTALLAGAALSVSGLLLQTTFRNPLAGPDVFGISSGASLAVAIVMFILGGNISLGSYTTNGYLAILVSAFVGAMIIICIISLLSTMVKSHVVLLIIGIMIGYLASSAISLLNFYATAEGVKSYMIWGLGSFGNVTMGNVPLLAGVVLVGSFFAMMMSKPLNALLLGEQYAASLGFEISKIRLTLLLITGVLTAVVTAFCGPIAFIGLVTPHLARMLLSTDNHRLLIPFTMIAGSLMAQICNLLCSLPCWNGTLPLNAVTPLFGAPIVIYILLRVKG